jgi:putative FmdB family regulatory protein
MPTYQVRCIKCEAEYEQFHRMKEQPDPCKHCGGRVVNVPVLVSVIVKDSGWESENGGRGRYIGQMAERQPFGACDPNAYVKSRTDLKEKAKRKGATTSEF